MMPRHRSDPGSGSGQPRFPGSFIAAFREALAELGWKSQRYSGPTVECTDADGHEQIVNLENCYRRARKADRAKWPKLIATFLKCTARIPTDGAPEDLDEVADQLLLRLGPAMPGGEQAAPIWQKPIEGTPLSISLVLEFPQVMFCVSETIMGKSVKPHEEWLARALDNLQRLTPRENLELAHEESGLLQCSVCDGYDSARALLLEAMLPESGRYGFVVALPGRDELLVLPVTAKSLNYLPLLKQLAEHNCKSEAYPISDQLFWIRDGKWQVLPMVVQSDGQVSLQPSEEFIAVLREVIPEAEVKSEAKLNE